MGLRPGTAGHRSGHCSSAHQREGGAASVPTPTPPAPQGQTRILPAQASCPGPVLVCVSEGCFPPASLCTWKFLTALEGSCHLVPAATFWVWAWLWVGWLPVLPCPLQPPWAGGCQHLQTGWLHFLTRSCNGLPERRQAPDHLARALLSLGHSWASPADARIWL